MKQTRKKHSQRLRPRRPGPDAASQDKPRPQPAVPGAPVRLVRRQPGLGMLPSPVPLTAEGPKLMTPTDRQYLKTPYYGCSSHQARLLAGFPREQIDYSTAHSHIMTLGMKRRQCSQSIWNAGSESSALPAFINFRPLSTAYSNLVWPTAVRDAIRTKKRLLKKQLASYVAG